MNQAIHSETAAVYHFETDNEIITQALKILEKRLIKPETFIKNPDDTKAFLQLKLGELEHEVFSGLFLNNQHGVIQYSEMFRGTIDGASVYPREVVKKALACNAAAVIFAHNHPSGHTEPSAADKQITEKLTEALKTVDIRVLDHLIVGHGEALSFAEQGLL